MSMSLSYEDIRKRVGLERGYGTDTSSWTDAETEIVEMCLKQGASMFYNSFEWSFLSPLVTMVLQSGTEERLMPDNFGHLVGEVFYTGSTTYVHLPVESESKVLTARQNDTTGQPTCAAIITASPDTMHGSRYKLIWFPECDQDYTVTFRYSVIPEALSIHNPYPFGGAIHAHTIQEAILAASEQLDGKNGIHTDMLPIKLEESKNQDRMVQARLLRDEQVRTGVALPIVTYSPGIQL